ncbi:MAG TPA: lamin tail domain-containing protein [Herpetosiphonaceae bacterium]
MQRKAYPIPFSMPSLERLRSADLLIPLILCLAFVLPLLLAFLGVGIRTDKETALVLNEVFVLPQKGAEAWVELYNNTDEPIAIDGWRLGTASDDVATLEGTVAPHAYRVIKTPGAWNEKSDAVILYGVDGSQVDHVYWGPAPEKSPIVGWSKTGAGAASAPKPGAALVRNPQGLDSDTAKDWRGARPSPNGQSPVSLSTGTYRLLFDITNYVSLIAGFLLWGAFILIGLIARRFEMLTGQRSFWIAMVVAPIGIVIYNIIQSYAFFTAGVMSECKTGLGFSACQQGWAFTALCISAMAMAYVVYRFYGIARRILEV